MRLVVSDADEACTATTHLWPIDFEYGDACRCGAYALTRNPTTHEIGVVER
jgi:hypothetical protein